MGFGGIIATGIMLIVLIVTGYLILASLNYSVDTASASIATVRDTGDDRLHTSLGISDVSVSTGRIDFNMTNTGDTGIEDIADMDLIIKSIADGDVTQCTWFPYDNSTATGADHWYVLYQVKYPGNAPGFGPGDVMRVRCIYGTGAPSEAGQVVVTTPGGTAATLLYHVAKISKAKHDN